MDAEGAADELRDERVRRVRLVGRAARRHPLDVGAERETELGREPRLPHARLTADVHEAPRAGDRAFQGGAEGRQLRLASDERAHVRLDLVVAAPDDAIGRDGLGLPLQRDRRERLELERVEGEASRRLGYEHLVQRRDRLEPLRRVHRVAHNGVRALDVAPEEPGDDLAGVDADPQRETHAVLALEVVVQRLDGTLHGERGADRAFGVVLVRQRRAEHGHDRVADVLVDRALVASDLPREGVEVRAEDPAEVLRIELLGEGRRS